MEKKIDCDIVAITHRLWIDDQRKTGGIDMFIRYCSLEKGKKILFIEHPLISLKEKLCLKQKDTFITLISGENWEILYQKSLHKGSEITGWIKEFLFNIKFLTLSVKGRPVLFAADPLNGLVGMAIPFKFRRKYLHCTDYSDNRFDNLILNGIYFVIYRLAVYFFDYIAVVSLKTYELFLRICPAKKIIHVPSSPLLFKPFLGKRKKKYSLICTGGTISPKYCYVKIINIVKDLKKKFPQVLLFIIGGLEQDKKYVVKLKKLIRKYKLEQNVKLIGFLKKETLANYYQKVSVGFSFYSKDVNYYMKYADPLKVREYAFFGIPIIVDGNSSVDNEVVKEKVGFLAKNRQQAVDFISLLFGDKRLYSAYSKRCILWSKKYDKRKIFDTLYRKLFT